MMLVAGSIACIVTYLNHYNLKDMLVALLWVMLIFFAFGVIIELLFEKFEIEKKEEDNDDDGEVVEKTSENQEEEESSEDDSDVNNE